MEGMHQVPTLSEIEQLNGYLESANYTMTMQAREIERLKDALERQLKAADTECRAALDVKDAEIERLRAALVGMLNVYGALGALSGATKARDVVAAAREALAPHKQG